MKSWMRRTVSLLIAAVLMLAALPAALAVPYDWAQLQIGLSWTDAEGNTRWYQAYPVYEQEGSFWAYVDPDVPLYELAVSLFAPGLCVLAGKRIHPV